MVAGGDRHDANREFISWLKQARVRAGDPSDKWIEQDSGIPHSTVHDWTSIKGKRKRLPDWDKQVAPLLVSLSQYAEEKGRNPDRTLGTLQQWKLAYDDTQIRGHATCPLPALDPREEDASLPVWDIAEAGNAAPEQQGWLLASDQDGARHWRSSARGVSNEAQRGWRFRGRIRALERIVSWLDRPRPDRQVLVVTGSPGIGKSAVLGRVVTTADSGVRAEMPADDTGVLASPGSVQCAVHAKGKTALDVAKEIARAARAAPPGEPADLAINVLDALGEHASGFNVVIDALDEAASPQEARDVIDKIVLALAQNCADAGVQVVVGARRRDDRGDLLGWFGPAADVLDLDDPEYFEQEDLAAYAQACLQMDGGDSSPYVDATEAGLLATQIAQASAQNFLIAGLIARSCSLHPEAVDPVQLTVSQTVRSALDGYLRRLGPVAGVPADRLLTALAFAEPPGLPAGLWQMAVKTLYRVDVAVEDLAEFARSAAANFLVETADTVADDNCDPASTPSYRLFHQALNDTLLNARADTIPRAADERKLTHVFTARGRDRGWERSPSYLLRSLPAHAARAGMVDDLLADDEYLLHVNLSRILQIADGAKSPDAQDHARLLRCTPLASLVGPAERAAMFSVTEALYGLGTAYRDARQPVPYRARWAVANPRQEDNALRPRVCAVQVGDRPVLAVSFGDGTVQLSDPANGTLLHALEGHTSGVIALCALQVGDRTLLATASDDGAVRLWDPANGTLLHALKGHTSGVKALWVIQNGDRTLLVTASDDGTWRVWDLAKGTQLHALEGYPALRTVQVSGRTLLATVSNGTVLLTDPANGTLLHALEGHTSGVIALCALQVGDRTLLATACHDWTVRVWDLANGTQFCALEGSTGTVIAMCGVQAGNRTLLATAGWDRTVRLWDPTNGTCTLTIPVHHPASALTQVGSFLAVGHWAGVLVTNIETGTSPHTPSLQQLMTL